MDDSPLTIKSVAIIGAGVSGVAAAVHLTRVGLDVTVFERTARAGGIWVYDNRIAKDAAYPSLHPSTGDSPEYELVSKRLKSDLRQDSPFRDLEENRECEATLARDDVQTSFAPPGPCYSALRNNVSTIEMEMSCQGWKPNTPDFVPHRILADYIHESAQANGIVNSISFNTRVDHVRKTGDSWELSTGELVGQGGNMTIVDRIQHFDAVVVASGHYHAPNVPDLAGLSAWKEKFPGSVQHSKCYRSPEQFRDRNVLLIGAGVSSVDIARDLGSVARSVYQSSRGGPYDLPSHLLPNNAARIGAIRSFESPHSSDLSEDGSIPAVVILESGRRLCGIHHVIVCTGYHVSFPFMRQYHADAVLPEDADEEVLVTNGQQTHNLHKDIWYISDPTLAFIGAPYHVATFTLFEFQAMALAAVFAGRARLPTRKNMRKEYTERLKRNGAGRTFHSLKKRGDEIAYVNELVGFVNESAKNRITMMRGHSDRWHEAYMRRGLRQQALFSAVRDPALDAEVLALIEGC